MKEGLEKFSLKRSLMFNGHIHLTFDQLSCPSNVGPKTSGKFSPKGGKLLQFLSYNEEKNCNLKFECASIFSTDRQFHLSGSRAHFVAQFPLAGVEIRN